MLKRKMGNQYKNNILRFFKSLFNRVEKNELYFIHEFMNLTKKEQHYQLEVYNSGKIIFQMDSLRFVPIWLNRTKGDNTKFEGGYVLFFWFNKRTLKKNKYYKNLISGSVYKKLSSQFEMGNSIFFMKFFQENMNNHEVLSIILAIYDEVYKISENEKVNYILRHIPNDFKNTPSHKKRKNQD